MELSQNIRQATDVVFMAVGENNALNLFLVRRQIRDIRNHTIYAQQIFRWKGHSCVNDDDLILIFDGCHILPNLFKSAQWDDLDAIFWFLLRNNNFLLLHRIADPTYSALFIINNFSSGCKPRGTDKEQAAASRNDTAACGN